MQEVGAHLRGLSRGVLRGSHSLLITPL
eukprot:SAG31_NODE_46680_length_253_cov_0.935065_1_plen_27_part_01